MSNGTESPDISVITVEWIMDTYTNADTFPIIQHIKRLEAVMEAAREMLQYEHGVYIHTESCPDVEVLEPGVKWNRLVSALQTLDAAKEGGWRCQRSAT